MLNRVEHEKSFITLGPGRNYIYIADSHVFVRSHGFAQPIKARLLQN